MPKTMENTHVITTQIKSTNVLFTFCRCTEKTSVACSKHLCTKKRHLACAFLVTTDDVLTSFLIT